MGISCRETLTHRTPDVRSGRQRQRRRAPRSGRPVDRVEQPARPHRLARIQLRGPGDATAQVLLAVRHALAVLRRRARRRAAVQLRLQSIELVARQVGSIVDDDVGHLLASRARHAARLAMVQRDALVQRPRGSKPVREPSRGTLGGDRVAILERDRNPLSSSRELRRPQTIDLRSRRRLVASIPPPCAS